MEGGPWLHYYLTEIAAGHWERAADLTRASTGNPRAAVIDGHLEGGAWRARRESLSRRSLAGQIGRRARTRPL